MDGFTKKLGSGGANWLIISINPLKNMIWQEPKIDFPISMSYWHQIFTSPPKLIVSKEPEKLLTKKTLKS
jgi:hypothetical protein